MTLDLDARAAGVELPDEAAQARARDLLGPAAGRLADHAAWLAGAQGRCPTAPLERVRLVVFAGDHGVAALGASSQTETTAARVRALLAGAGAVAAAAADLGVGVRVVDISVDDDLADLPADVGRHKVRRGGGVLGAEQVCSAAEVEAGLAAGMAVADEEIDSGADLLLAADLGAGSTAAATALVAALTRMDVVEAVGQSAGLGDAGWMRKVTAVRDAVNRARPLLADRMALLAQAGGADLAAQAGFLLQAAARRTPVVLDGLVGAACGLVVQRIAYRAPLWWLAGHLTSEPAHTVALDRLELRPALDLSLSRGGGLGALLAVPLLRSASALLTEAAIPAS